LFTQSLGELWGNNNQGRAVGHRFGHGLFDKNSLIRNHMGMKISFSSLAFFLCFTSCSQPFKRFQSEPIAVSSDFMFHGSDKRTTVPFEFFDNRILVPVYINDSGPFMFLFDTGGGNAITPQVAEKLGLKTKEGHLISGAGEKKEMAGKTKIEKYQIGSLTLHGQDFIVFDLEFLKKAFGFSRLDGAFGFQVLERVSTIIDFEKREITFGENLDRSNLGGQTERLEFEFQDGKPIINGEINDQPSKIMIDTGDRSSFTIFSRFAKNTNLSRLFENNPEVISGFGVGGPIRAKWGSIKELSLGSKIALKQVLARLPTAKNGGFADMDISGSIGNQVLKRFNILFDYKKKEIFLRKNSNLGAPYRFVPPKAIN
jgi:hypothetical protein